MKAVYFKNVAEFRRWLAAHHGIEPERLVGFYKKALGTPGISYKEAVDEALCFGGIDGILTYWVMSAKQQETRERRLATLARSSAEGTRIR